ncbi:phage antirepressor KilAC domain-containing protein [Salsuginibacillus halophilus]|nr:phage antirepressor KilAC domain-containing protein [Salsuginibacillus halophilus]
MNLEIFEHSRFGSVRVVNQGGEPYFALVDLCEVLDLGQASAVKRRIEDDVISNHPIEDSIGREQFATFVNEDGLYDVILDSRKPEAKGFRKWVTSEVLPSIRKTGGYQVKTPQTYAEALRLAADQAEEMERNKPKVEAHDRFISGENLQTMGDIAQSLGWGRNNLFKELRAQGVLKKNNTPYQRFIDAGYFSVKQTPIKNGRFNKPQTYVTAKGVDWLDKQVNGNKKDQLPQTVSR